MSRHTAHEMLGLELNSLTLKVTALLTDYSPTLGEPIYQSFSYADLLLVRELKAPWSDPRPHRFDLTFPAGRAKGLLDYNEDNVDKPTWPRQSAPKWFAFKDTKTFKGIILI